MREEGSEAEAEHGVEKKDPGGTHESVRSATEVEVAGEGVGQSVAQQGEDQQIRGQCEHVRHTDDKRRAQSRLVHEASLVRILVEQVEFHQNNRAGRTPQAPISGRPPSSVSAGSWRRIRPSASSKPPPAIPDA